MAEVSLDGIISDGLIIIFPVGLAPAPISLAGTISDGLTIARLDGLNFNS